MKAARVSSIVGATRAMVGKELTQHGLAAIMTTVLLLVCWGLVRASFAQQARNLSVLEPVATFVRWPLTLAALLWGYRLVVGETYGRTQRFLEALPMPRWFVPVFKAVVGFGLVAAWGAAALALGLLDAWKAEPLGAPFIALLASRLIGYVIALWGLVFLLGTVGRLRLFLALAMALAVGLLDRWTGWQLEDFGPFALMSPSAFALSRTGFPTAAFTTSVALGAGAIAIGIGLALVRDGGLVEALAKPLSVRELSALAVIAIGGLSAFAAAEANTPPKPYEVLTDKVLRDPRTGLEIVYFDDELRHAAQRLRPPMTALLHRLARRLGLDLPLAPVRLVHAPEAGVDNPASALVDTEQGIVLRFNFAEARTAPLIDLAANVVHQYLVARSAGRNLLESRHVFLDGFSLALAVDSVTNTRFSWHDPTPWLLRGLAAVRSRPMEVETVRSYHTLAETVGEMPAQALMATGWRVLEDELSDEALARLTRRLLGRRGTGDVRDFLHDRRAPAFTAVEEETGMGFPAFVAAWAAALEAAARHPAVARHLSSLPAGSVRLSHQPSSGWGLVARFEPSPAPNSICAVKHVRLPPYDRIVPAGALEQDRFLWPPGKKELRRDIPGEYGRGERAFLALDCRVSSLAADLRLYVRRATAP